MVRERADNVNSAGGGTNDPGSVDFGNFAELYSRPGTVLAGKDTGEQRADDSVSHHGEQLAGELSQTWGPESRAADAMPQNLAIATDLPLLDLTDQAKVADASRDGRASQPVDMNEASKDAIASASRLAYNPDIATKLYRSFDRLAQG
jgi:hypothetical protein